MTADAAALTRAHAYCEEVVRERAKNFWYGLKMLPEPTRSSLYVVYAWMREVDDIADAPGADRVARSYGLDLFQARTRSILHGERMGPDERPLWVAFADLASRHELDPAPFEEMIEGQRLDLDWTSCPDRPTLEHFCRLVASTVGRICIRIWGHDGGSEVEELANQRGLALQLTNILRDVREDHARGRSYLPADELAAAGLSIDDLLAWRNAGVCRTFVLGQVEQARGHYAAARSLESHITASCRGTSWAMGEIYRALLERIADDPERIVHERVSLGKLQKAAIALKAKTIRRSGG
jgi:phytoene synthase